MAELTSGSLYVVLHLRNNDVADNNYHWGLYLHQNTNGADAHTGYKYHIASFGGRWMPDYGITTGVLKSMLLVCLVRVGAHIPSSRFKEFEAVIKAVDSEINNGAYTCSIWTRRALERLKVAGFIKHNDIEALIEELRNIGNAHRVTAIMAERPRPVRTSMLSA